MAHPILYNHAQKFIRHGRTHDMCVAFGYVEFVKGSERATRRMVRLMLARSVWVARRRAMLALNADWN